MTAGVDLTSETDVIQSLAHRPICNALRPRVARYVNRVPTASAELADLLDGRQVKHPVIEPKSVGHEVIVGDPNFAPMYAQRSRRVKTDWRDARALMEACKVGAYKPAHRCSDVHKRVRARISARDLLVQTRTKCISLVRALLRHEGIKPERKSSATFAQRVREIGVPEALANEIAPVLDLIDALNEKIRRADERVSELAKDDTHQRLMTVPGVGPVTAVAFTILGPHRSAFRRGINLARHGL